MKAACILLVVSVLVAVFDWVAIAVSVPIIATHFLGQAAGNNSANYTDDNYNYDLY